MSCQIYGHNKHDKHSPLLLAAPFFLFYLFLDFLLFSWSEDQSTCLGRSEYNIQNSFPVLAPFYMQGMPHVFFFLLLLLWNSLLLIQEHPVLSGTGTHSTTMPPSVALPNLSKWLHLGGLSLPVYAIYSVYVLPRRSLGSHF